ncbi:phage baseplate protein [Anaerostipes sp.]|uniref:phage baseplate protein n=1 Tax=Anaerostipes sp. TaxID=1872530 RepID=UPI0025BAD7A0|nr:hypothetical protein [Anaerostipes sp.]MBS7007057.1 hypothetical protein [Anaerostipes sp.]
MNAWKSAVITKKGQALQDKLIAGEILKFTKVQTGTGEALVSELEDQTELTGANQIITFQKIEEIDGHIDISVLLENTKLLQGYELWQVGIFALDPDEGEILYCLVQAAEAKTIPAASEEPGFSVTWKFHLKNSGKAETQISITPAGLVDFWHFDERKNQVNQKFQDVEVKMGNLDNLKTSEKQSLVLAVNELKNGVDRLNQTFLEKTYPMGSIYTSISPQNPSALFGGEWKEFAKGQVLVGVNTADPLFNAAEKTGGNKNSVVAAHNHSVNGLTVSNVGNHSHTINSAGNHRHGVYADVDCITSAAGARDLACPEKNKDTLWESATPYAGNHTHSMSGSGGHNHTVPGHTTNTSGGDGTNKNLQPYITVYYWKRTG